MFKKFERLEEPYIYLNGRSYKMETVTKSGNYIARGVRFHTGNNCFHFSDAEDKPANRLGYAGDKSVCTLFRFPLVKRMYGAVLVNCAKRETFDVVLIPGLFGYDFQIRFSRSAKKQAETARNI